MAVSRPLPSYRSKTPLCHHTLVHRGLGRIANGDAARKESKYDQRNYQQRPSCHGETNSRGHAILVPRKLNGHEGQQSASTRVCLLLNVFKSWFSRQTLNLIWQNLIKVTTGHGRKRCDVKYQFVLVGRCSASPDYIHSAFYERFACFLQPHFLFCYGNFKSIDWPSHTS